MATVAKSARLSTADGAVWRTCAACARLAPLPPSTGICDTCTATASEGDRTQPTARDARAERLRQIEIITANAITSALAIRGSVLPDVVRVAALSELAAAAAALARQIAHQRHVDPAAVVPFVKDRTDLFAVLGRGRWLPTMLRQVPVPSTGPTRIGVIASLMAPRPETDTLADERRGR